MYIPSRPSRFFLLKGSVEGSTEEAVLTIALNNALSQISTGIFEAIYSQDMINSIAQVNNAVYIGNIVIGCVSDISQLSSYSTDGFFIQNIIGDISQVSDTSIEATITLPLFSVLSSGAIYTTSQISTLDLDQSISSENTGIFEAVYLQDVTSSIAQVASIITDNEAIISVNINLSDQYDAVATLNAAALLELVDGLSSIGSHVIDVAYSDNSIYGLSNISYITIEGATSLGIDLNVAETVTSIIDSAIGLDIELSQLQSATGVLLSEYLEDLSLSAVGVGELVYFENTELGTSVSISQGVIITDFIVVSPNKRILISLDSDRLVVSFTTDRLITSLSTDRDITSLSPDRDVSIVK